MRRIVLLFSALLAFAVNPSFGCGPSGFQFGESEMHAAVDGRWRITWTEASGASSNVTVDISGFAESRDGGTDSAMHPRKSGSFIRTANACESRSFFLKPASACSDDTRMSLRVTYVEGDSVQRQAPTSAMFSVYGLEFTTGYLELSFGDATTGIGINPSGTVTYTRELLHNITQSDVTVTAQRISR